MLVRHQGSSLVVFAPAKLNLFLDIAGKRPDGYHQLETVMVSVGLHDTLCFAADESSRIQLSCRSEYRSATAPELPVDAGNLVVRAAEHLRNHTGTRQGAVIALIKRIPLQAGLGGGSSDAAATLVGLNRLWNLGLSREELHRLAADLGSDINFFLDSSQAALCRGRGELIEPLPLARPLHFVVCCPDARAVWTGDVFRQWVPVQTQCSPDTLVDWLRRGGAFPWKSSLHNALEAPAQHLNGEIERTLRILRHTGVMSAAMSGSG